MHIRLLLITILLLTSTYAQKTETKVYKTGFTAKEGFEKLAIFVRYPKSYEKLKGNGKWKPTIIINSHIPSSMMKKVVGIAQAKADYYRLYYVLSEQHGLPIITYNCPRYNGGFYSRDGNDWELTERAVAVQYKKFLKIDTIWKKSIENFCQEQGLESKGFLGVGLSTGAQYLNRVAMIHPEMFHSVESIMPGSNPAPSAKAKDLHWLFISGTHDGGYANCNRFFEKAKEVGYKNSFYIAPNGVGHGSGMTSVYLESFKKAYYAYLFEHQGNPPENSKTYVGDYINNIASHQSKSDWIPEGQRVYLPSLAMAKAWGEGQD